MTNDEKIEQLRALPERGLGRAHVQGSGEGRGEAAEWNKIRFDFGWRKINAKHWWAHDLGSATRTPKGWVASASAYEDVILEPNVGPFRTAQEAMIAWTKKRRSA